MLAFGMGLALRPLPRTRRGLLPAEAESHQHRGELKLLEASIEHVDALTETLRNGLGAGLPSLRLVMADTEICHRTRGALLWVRLDHLETDEIAHVLKTLLSDPEFREPSLHAVIELAANGDVRSSRRLLDALEYEPGVAEAARPALWALLLSGPYDVERRALSQFAVHGTREDAQDLLRYFGSEPELFHLVQGAVENIRDRNGAHGLSIVAEQLDSTSGALSVLDSDEADKAD